MKLSKEYITAIYTTKMPSFAKFYELKCKLPDEVVPEFIDVKEEFYPEGVSSILAHPYDYDIEMTLHFDVESGETPVTIRIDFFHGDVRVEFSSEIHTTGQDLYFSETEFESFVSSHLPVIESFLDKLNKLERNKPCEDGCYYNRQRIKRGGCEYMFIHKSEYTPFKNTMLQRIIKHPEIPKKGKYDL
jgi:hypothetical protein